VLGAMGCAVRTGSICGARRLCGSTCRVLRARPRSLPDRKSCVPRPNIVATGGLPLTCHGMAPHEKNRGPGMAATSSACGREKVTSRPEAPRPPPPQAPIPRRSASPDAPEFLFVDDGNTDDTRQSLEALRDRCESTAMCWLCPRTWGRRRPFVRACVPHWMPAPSGSDNWDADLSTPLGVIDDFRRELDARPDPEVISRRQGPHAGPPDPASGLPPPGRSPLCHHRFLPAPPARLRHSVRRQAVPGLARAERCPRPAVPITLGLRLGAAPAVAGGLGPLGLRDHRGDAPR
jgi:hypothetical protein